jgi:hypothetical protein
VSGRRADDLLKPCGTDAAYKRHLRRGEQPCRECKAAAARRRRGGGAALARTPDYRAPRNGLPVRPYVYGAPRQAWARRALVMAEAEHGTPDSTPDYDAVPLLDDMLARGYARRAGGER